MQTDQEGKKPMFSRGVQGGITLEKEEMEEQLASAETWEPRDLTTCIRIYGVRLKKGMLIGKGGLLKQRSKDHGVPEPGGKDHNLNIPRTARNHLVEKRSTQY